jgi:antitoxin component of RelBE/YafQ-DinJ toxin-antitoxin module
MQTGNRLGYHPEHAQEEIAHFHQVLPQAQAAVARLGTDAKQRLEQFAQRMSRNNAAPADLDAQRQRRLDALERAQNVIAETRK